MADGRWQRTEDRWQMADGSLDSGWRLETGDWRLLLWLVAGDFPSHHSVLPLSFASVRSKVACEQRGETLAVAR